MYKFDQISTGHHYVINGFARVTNNTHSVQGGRQTGSSTFMLRSSDAVTTVMNTSKALDTSYHTHKLTANPSDVKIEIDGTLEATKTTNHPTLSMQPEIFVQVMSNSGNVTQNIRYMECYNT